MRNANELRAVEAIEQRPQLGHVLEEEEVGVDEEHALHRSRQQQVQHGLPERHGGVAAREYVQALVQRQRLRRYLAFVGQVGATNEKLLRLAEGIARRQSLLVAQQREGHRGAGEGEEVAPDLEVRMQRQRVGGYLILIGSQAQCSAVQRRPAQASAVRVRGWSGHRFAVAGDQLGERSRVIAGGRGWVTRVYEPAESAEESPGFRWPALPPGGVRE